ncbi:hypothetical protein C2G38_2232211 [Gigaspora rosea]|uniref:Uncharacterized protein n=1 Tax=Gigaspora rosea TaxID=44941 RepID=A0A397TU92_9GLOM|nr:hypothetical protein C2G38_2232211 [Gigaspora rosea]
MKVLRLKNVIRFLVHLGVSKKQVQVHQKMSFATELNKSLKMDPNDDFVLKKNRGGSSEIMTNIMNHLLTWIKSFEIEPDEAFGWKYCPLMINKDLIESYSLSFIMDNNKNNEYKKALKDINKVLKIEPK